MWFHCCFPSDVWQLGAHLIQPHFTAASLQIGTKDTLCTHSAIKIGRTQKISPQSKIIFTVNSVLPPKGTVLPKKQPVIQHAERDGWTLVWGAVEHLFLENLAFPTHCHHQLFSSQDAVKTFFFCQDKLVRSTKNILGLCGTFFSPGKFYSTIFL